MSVEMPLWTPSAERVAAALLTAFAAAAEQRAGRRFSTYAELHGWSVADRSAFWDLVWDFCGVIGDKGARVLVDGDRMPGAKFFPDARLNFAENLLRGSGPGEAIVFRGEDKVERRLSWDELAALVSKLQQLFVTLGVGKGDRLGCERRERLIERLGLADARGNVPGGAEIVDDKHLAGAGELVGHRCDLGADLDALAGIEVAVRGDEHLGLDLAEAVEHALFAEVGRARRPHRADRGSRQCNRKRWAKFLGMSGVRARAGDVARFRRC